jgi:hypothetical protein
MLVAPLANTQHPRIRRSEIIYSKTVSLRAIDNKT